MNNTKRELLFDIIRFYAIVLVVLGHAIQFNNENYLNNYIFKIIYSFHMPLFMFIAGYVSSNSFNKKILDIVKDKFNNLYLPFFISSMIYLSYKSDFNSSIIINLLIHPDSGYWFLYTLFCIYIIFKALLQFYHWNKLLAAVVYVGLYTLPSYFLALGLIKFHLTFFIAGYLTYHYKNFILLFYETHKYLLKYIVIILLIAALFYQPGSAGYYISDSYLIIQKIIIYITKVILAFLGIISVFYLASRFKPSLLLSEMGRKYTLHIYIIHIYFITMVHTEFHAVNTITNFIFSLIASILIAKILETDRFAIFHKLLFGRKR